MENYQSIKHNVFVSFHNKDEQYRLDFEANYAPFFTSKSVQNGDIDPDNKDEYTKRLVRENYISDSSVIVVLYGAETKNRKHVDWEISAGLSADAGGHSGLVVMILPTFPISPFDEFGNFKKEMLYDHVHPRTAQNIASGFADVYFWPGMYNFLPPVHITQAIETAFQKRISHKDLIDNSETQYVYNR
jgi:hypothetical protein